MSELDGRRLVCSWLQMAQIEEIENLGLYLLQMADRACAESVTTKTREFVSINYHHYGFCYFVQASVGQPPT